jgi:prepilin-type N-terminal cleavage/methylation domain-containing protein
MKGFSLSELIVVIAIVAVMSAVAMASFTALTGDRLVGDGRKIVNDLCWLRQMAVAGRQYLTSPVRRQYIAVFDTANNSYTLFYDLNNNGAADPATERIKTQGLSSGVDLVSVTPLPAQISFYYPQAAITQTKTITLTSQGKTRQVRVFGNTGYIRMQ